MRKIPKNIQRWCQRFRRTAMEVSYEKLSPIQKNNISQDEFKIGFYAGWNLMRRLNQGIDSGD